MNGITKKLALMTASAAVLATLVSTNATADVSLVKTSVSTTVVGSNIALLHPVCLTAAADATLTVTSAMTDAANSTVSSTSPNTAYTQTACKGYIVDTKFVSTPGGGFGQFVDGGLESVPNSAQACEFSQYHISYYRKAAGATEFTSVGGGFAKGVWTGATSGFGSNTCGVNRLANFQNKTQGVAAGDTWRLVVRGVEQAEPAKVKVTAGNQVIPH